MSKLTRFSRHGKASFFDYYVIVLAACSLSLMIGQELHQRFTHPKSSGPAAVYSCVNDPLLGAPCALANGRNGIVSCKPTGTSLICVDLSK